LGAGLAVAAADGGQGVVPQVPDRRPVGGEGVPHPRDGGHHTGQCRQAPPGGGQDHHPPADGRRQGVQGAGRDPAGPVQQGAVQVQGGQLDGAVVHSASLPSTNVSTASATPSSLLEAVMKRAAAFTSGKALAMATPSPAALTMAVSLPPSPQAIRALAGRPSRSARASRAEPLLTPAAVISRFEGIPDTASTPRGISSALARWSSAGSSKKMVSFSMPRSWDAMKARRSGRTVRV